MPHRCVTAHLSSALQCSNSMLVQALVSKGAPARWLKATTSEEGYAAVINMSAAMVKAARLGLEELEAWWCAASAGLTVPLFKLMVATINRGMSRLASIGGSSNQVLIEVMQNFCNPVCIIMQQARGAASGSTASTAITPITAQVYARLLLELACMGTRCRDVLVNGAWGSPAEQRHSVAMWVLLAAVRDAVVVCQRQQVVLKQQLQDSIAEAAMAGLAVRLARRTVSGTVAKAPERMMGQPSIAAGALSLRALQPIVQLPATVAVQLAWAACLLLLPAVLPDPALIP